MFALVFRRTALFVPVQPAFSAVRCGSAPPILSLTRVSLPLATTTRSRCRPVPVAQQQLPARMHSTTALSWCFTASAVSLARAVPLSTRVAGRKSMRSAARDPSLTKSQRRALSETEDDDARDLTRLRVPTPELVEGTETEAFVKRRGRLPKVIRPADAGPGRPPTMLFQRADALPMPGAADFEADSVAPKRRGRPPGSKSKHPVPVGPHADAASTSDVPRSLAQPQPLNQPPSRSMLVFPDSPDGRQPVVNEKEEFTHQELFDLLSQPVAFPAHEAVPAPEQQWSRTESVRSIFKRLPLTDETATVVLRQFAAQSRTADITELFGMMREQDIVVNIFHYNSYLTLFAHNGDVDGALKVLDQMKLENVTPSLHTYSALLSACAVAKDLPRALEIVEQARSAGVTPDNVMLTTLMKVAMMAGRSRDVAEIFGYFKNTADEVAYSLMIRSLAATGEAVRHFPHFAVEFLSD